jgi:hypothetical protein
MAYKPKSKGHKKTRAIYEIENESRQKGTAGLMVTTWSLGREPPLRPEIIRWCHTCLFSLA